MIPKIEIHNIQTGEITSRDMTADELAQYEKDKLTREAEKQLAADKAAAKATAEAKLAALGLTTDDLKALGLGGN